MLELSTLIFEGLSGQTIITDIFSQKIYPLIAPEKIRGPFIIYKVTQNGQTTKDGRTEYTITIQNHGENYDDVIIQAQAIAAAMWVTVNTSTTKIFKFTEGIKDPGLTEDFKTYCEQIFNIKI